MTQPTDSPCFHVVPGNTQYIGKRSEQQDAFGFSDLFDCETLCKRGALAVLADGMGGMLYGREASTCAVSTFLSKYSEVRKNKDTEDALDEAINSANTSVYTLAADNKAVGQMGTTLAAAVVDAGRLFWVSAGDSRVYVFRDNYLIQQTQDHVYGALLDEQAAKGIITPEEARQNSERHALFSFLGLSEIERVDKNKAPVKLLEGDKILLCSDGLYNTLDCSEISACMRYPAQEAAEMLVGLIKGKDRPAQDNTTVLVMEFHC